MVFAKHCRCFLWKLRAFIAKYKFPSNSYVTSVSFNYDESPSLGVTRSIFATLVTEDITVWNKYNKTFSIYLNI